MTYRAWTRKYGSIILEEGPTRAALLAGVPTGFAKRYAREARHRDHLARRMGGTSRFNVPPPLSGTGCSPKQSNDR